MKKIISLVVLCLSIQSATSFATTQPVSNVQKDVAVLIEHAQSHNLSAEQTLLLAQQAIDQAAYVDDFGIEVPQDNHKKMMIIAGVVVVVIVIGGIAYYYFSEKKMNTARELAEEVIKKIDEGVSVKKMTEWAENLNEDLNDFEKVYWVRAMDELVNQILQGMFSGRIINGSESEINNFVRDNLVRIVDAASERPVTDAEITQARQRFAK